MAEVILQPMTEPEFEIFMERTIREYADENVKAGYWQKAEAMTRSLEAHQKLLPDGLRTPEHHIFTVRDKSTGEEVGCIWLRVEKDRPVPSGFIFAVFISPENRGKGYGAGTMKAIETKAAEMGLHRLMLHVFAHNPVAIHLYEGAGYKVASINMIRDIP